MTKRATIFLIFGFLLMAAGLFLGEPRAVLAQDPQPTPSDDEVNRVAKQMFCPVCENIPLDVCPTTACQNWRELIRQKLAAGWSDQQIKQYFADQYGDRVLSEPPRAGLNWLVYVGPWLAFAVGAVLVWRVLASMRRKAAKAPEAESDPAQQPAPPAAAHQNAAQQPDADDPYLARLEEELKHRD
jgi:cytochrome c-type biogenesis protein CcmH